MLRNLVDYGDGEVEIQGFDVFREGIDEWKEIKVDPKTVGQFTGLCDADGKEIYEGDILMCIGQRKDNKGRKYLRKVLFKNGSFCMGVPEYYVDTPLHNHIINGKLNYEIVGNIYYNPELLKGGDQ